MMNPHKSASPEDLLRPEVLAMSSYHVPAASGLIKLDAMENPYRLPEDLQRALGERLAEVSINRYPAPSYTRLKALIRDRFAIPESCGLLLGNGSDELISLMSVALLPSVSLPRGLLMTLTIDELFLSTPEVLDPMRNAFLVTIARSCSRG
jgi:hypothetical protein